MYVVPSAATHQVTTYQNSSIDIHPNVYRVSTTTVYDSKISQLHISTEYLYKVTSGYHNLPISAIDIQPKCLWQ